VPIVLKAEGLSLLETCGPVQVCSGIALPLPLALLVDPISVHHLTRSNIHKDANSVKPCAVYNAISVKPCAVYNAIVCSLLKPAATCTFSYRLACRPVVNYILLGEKICS
jgi:hypothetical protein